MSKELDITVVTNDEYHPTHAMFRPGAPGGIPVLDREGFEQCAHEFDLVVYQIGNVASIHGYMLEAMQCHPGLVFLHDLCLHHAILGWAVGRGNPDAYVSEMRYNYGAEGVQRAYQVLSGRGEEIMNAYPLIDRVLDSSLALIVSNPYMRGYLVSRRPSLRVYHIPLQFQVIAQLSAVDPVAIRRSLGVGEGPLIITVGLTSPHNRLPIALRAFQRLVGRHPKATYVLIGSPQSKQELLDQIGHLGLGDRVRLTGWVSNEELAYYMHIADVAVQLRYPHAGGTSYPPILLLGLGVPTIISDIEPMADIPEDAIIRIQPEAADEEDQLFATLDYLLTHPEVASALAARGKAYVREHHALDMIAERFISAIREVAERQQTLRVEMQARQRAHSSQEPPSRGGMADLAAEALAQLGVQPPSDSLLRPLAHAIHELLADAARSHGSS
ncbi:MAG: glycosyltransferase family 4 protein [Anaerolineae bacterium]|nr:glycosyltransferase family 4 protein [Anaerolineae bacterium]